uniref:Ubiquitin-like protease family profile domain-containing protein n=1 Tax=Panagrolaimus sp. PS1159 TaxID=55785 RepID=A0AC35GTV5_9BILA
MVNFIKIDEFVNSLKTNNLVKWIKNILRGLFNVAVFLFFSLTFYNNANEIVKGKHYCILNIGGGKRRRNRDDEPSDAFEEPSFGYLNKNRKILLLSEKKHKTARDLYLDDNQVDALICGVAAFVGRKGIRKVSVLTSIFCTKLAADPDTDPITYMHIYKSNFDILLAPIVEEEHWYVAAFYVDTKIVTVYDSLHWPVPSIFPRLKKCIESVLHLQFTLKNDNKNITKQKNGYDCGVNCFRNAEEICFHEKCNLFIPYYPEAERARAREILRRLQNKEIKDDWVPHVVTPTHYTTLNRPTDEPEKIVNAKSSDSDVEILDEKKDISSKTDKKADDEKKDETNICDDSIGCLNDPIQKMGIDDSTEIKEDKKVLTNDEENETQQKIDENFIDYCNRKRIRKDSDARKEYNAEKNAAKSKLAQNEKKKGSKCETDKMKAADDKSEKDDKEYEILSVDEEIGLNKEALETVAEFCSRKRIKNDTKGKAKHKQSVKNAKEKLEKNEKAKDKIKTEDGCSDTVTDYNDLQLDLFFTLNSAYSVLSSLKKDPIHDLQLITGPLDKATVIVQIDRESEPINGKFIILGKDFNTIFIELWSTTKIESKEGSTWKFSGKIKLEGGVLLMDVAESSKFA